MFSLLTEPGSGFVDPSHPYLIHAMCSSSESANASEYSHSEPLHLQPHQRGGECFLYFTDQHITSEWIWQYWVPFLCSYLWSVR